MLEKFVPIALEKRKKEIFASAMRLPQSARAAFINLEAGADAALRDAVIRLVAAGSTEVTGALDRPVHAKPLKPRPEFTESIGPYTIVRELGTGGMGSVYSCRKRGGNLVAVKVLQADFHTPQFLKRFEVERDLHSRLDHPNICRLLDAGIAEHETPFIVMEMVHGQPIHAFCESERCTVPQVLRLFSQVLAGVEYFHRQQIVHRDLKPSNVLVTAAGKAKILDFGIAKIVEHRPGLTGHGPTQTPVPLMTIRYASPEQLEQRRSGRASDIYSLGVMLYEVLTGGHPFEHDEPLGRTEMLKAIASESQVPPSRRIGDKFAGVDRMLRKALRFEPRDRYGSAGEFLEDLRHSMEERVRAAVASRTGR